VVAVEMRRIAGVTFEERCVTGFACFGAVRVVNVGVGRRGAQQRTAEECAADGGCDYLLHGLGVAFR
jgi:hypothetical protein